MKRDDTPPERDHLSPGDLLSDTADESVDPTRIRTRTLAAIGCGTCARLRERLVGTDATARVAAADLDIDAAKETIADHYRGRCDHDIDTPPVKYDHDAAEWRYERDP